MKRANFLLTQLSSFLLATAILCACSDSEIKSDTDSNNPLNEELGMPIFAKKRLVSGSPAKNGAGQYSGKYLGQLSGQFSSPYSGRSPGKSESKIVVALSPGKSTGSSGGNYLGISSGTSRGISSGISSGQSGNIVSGTSLTGAFAGTFEPYAYIRALQECIREKWQITQILSTKSGVVSFAVDHTGSVSALLIKESSGSREFDRSMLSAVEHAVPLPPLVASAPAKVQVEFTFNERLFRGVDSKEDLTKIVSEQGLAFERNPKNYQALSRRGRARMRLGQYVQAIADYNVVISKTDDNVGVYLERAKCYLYIDAYKNALDDCLTCIQLAPALAKPYTLAAAAQLGLGHLEQAQTSIDTAVSLSPDDPEAWALRANCDNLALKHQSAIADATKAINLDRDYGSAYAYRGDAYEALKDYDAALRDYSKNVDLDPGEAQAFMRRTELFTTLGQFDKAVFDATEAIKLSPQNGEAYYYRAHANEELGLKAQAQKDLARAKQLRLAEHQNI